MTATDRATTAIRAELLGQLWSIRSDDDPYPIYRRLRDHGGLFEAEPGHWIATRHAEVKAVLSSRSALVGDPARQPTVEGPGELDLAFLNRNPPDHGRLRRLATPAFRPALMRGYRDQIVEQVDRLLTPVRPGEPFDVVRTLATPVPVAVICALLGIDGPDIAVFGRYGQVIALALAGQLSTAEQVTEFEAAKADLSALLARLAIERAQDPRDDVISHLAAAQPDGITAYELMVTARLLLIAGFETTVNLIGNATYALLTTAGAWDALVADPALAGPIVTESLRCDPPVQSTGRVLVEDLTVGAVTVPAGSWVSTLIGSANHDETVFGDPDVFDPTRPNADDHLAFSGGIHYCLGAPLARMEGEVALAGLAAHSPQLELLPSARRRAGTLIRGWATLPMVAS